MEDCSKLDGQRSLVALTVNAMQYAQCQARFPSFSFRRLRPDVALSAGSWLMREIVQIDGCRVASSEEIDDVNAYDSSMSRIWILSILRSLAIAV